MASTTALRQPVAAPLIATNISSYSTGTYGDRLDLTETAGTSVSEATAASHTQLQTPSNDLVFPFSAFDASLPLSFGFNFDGGDTLEWNDRDIDLMSGLWDVPSSGEETWLSEIDGPHASFKIQTESSATAFQIENAISWILDHFRRRSRTSSPTTNEARRLWYSAPPRLQIYDREVLNVLLNIARRHLATTFELFADFEANSDTSHELCLAMAAIGALFLGVECGFMVAKTLYNDARKLHFEEFHSQGLRSSFKAASDSVRTFILLAIYGICSGDKRSYEFVEAFHLSMMQAMKYYCQLAPSELESSNSRALSLTAEALHINESYHVLLLQRPPYFLLSSLGVQMNNSFKIDLTPLLCPIDGAEQVLGSLREVASLGAYTWASSPRGQEQSHTWQLWRPEFIELGLERWMNAEASSHRASNLSSLLIYYLSHIHLQVDLSFLQISALNFIKHPENDKEKKIHKMLKEYTCGRPFEASVWYAKAMLRLVRENLGISGHDQSRTADGRRILEPPHLPYCIYFSTLIAWYGEYTATGLRSLARDACIKNGIHLLGMLKVRVARVLIHALRELLPEEY